MRTQPGLTNPLASDLDHILKYTEGLWEDIRGKRLFITGGTGFFGSWLLESFAWANDKLNLNASALVLTRNHNTFKEKAPHLAENPAIQFHRGDIRTFTYPKGDFSHIIHAAATSARATFNHEDPLVKFDTVVQGTRHTLDFAVHCHARKFLLTSSGAVYGRQPSSMPTIPEEYEGAPCPDDMNAAWGESKRAAEFLCAYYSRRYGIETKLTRCFSFVGPYLPLDIHYAIGNFIQDGLNGGPIKVNGDGTPYRSYLYAADLTIWLWTILFKGSSCRPYNVGSEHAVSIAELARTVADCFPKKMAVKIAESPDPNKPPQRYVPSTKRAREECGVRQIIGMEEGIRKTICYAQSLHSRCIDQSGSRAL
ncbi:MAG TPA: NAD-dependent epimerase/dehydratase family protein [Deltaproteobacteria bacterium]|nr:NAD-dependent epimerase/dehydratase family protein [Deltaproteobacteria bacterium]HPJ92649.1 NAD-dependent epimerase/dehydratase family protein [Deltaproteobacteria bacterium]HPR55215.1 NAD-dependent epimerase/dehydratase family protein [Deltaproteobacteria bacterium]